MKDKKATKLVKQINEMGFKAFHIDNKLIISAEEGDDAADYYGEFRGGYPWINPKIEKWAKKHDLYIEWQNPGCLSVWEN